MEITTMTKKQLNEEKKFKRWYKNIKTSKIAYDYFSTFLILDCQKFKHIWYPDYIIWKLQQ
jgi:hypothetical protein